MKVTWNEIYTIIDVESEVDVLALGIGIVKR